MQARFMRTTALVILLSVLVWLVASCGGSRPSSPQTSTAKPTAANGGVRDLSAVLHEIDIYPTPKGVSAERWTMLVTALKKQLIARSKDGKTLSVAPTGAGNAVSDLAAVSNGAGTQATLTWTEKLAGDCSNDGSVDIADLQPIATHYGETSTGPGSAAYLADADGDGQVGISDLQPIANNYSAHLEGYQVWRGSFNGTSTDWEPVFRPNVANPSNTAFSADRTNTPPVSARPAYTYTDDISGLADKANVRYKVTAYGDGAPGQDSNEAIMPPPSPSTFNVSGTVLESGVGLAGVTMTLTPGGVNATTQADGTYSITGVADGTYTLTPSLAGYSFSPTSHSVTVSGADVTGQYFVATAVHSISGFVMDFNTSAGLGGVTMTLTPGGLTAVTAPDGNYTITDVPDGSYTLTPSLSGYNFSPTDRSVTVAGADLTEGFIATAVHSVSGFVMDFNTSAGLGGVTMTLTPGGPTAVTAPDGTYAIADVPDGGYTLTPSLSGYNFSPTDKSVTVSGADVTGQNFIATAVGLANTPWPKFHGDPRNTGLSAYVGAQTNTVKWTYSTGNAVYSSPAIGLDGTVYVGSNDFNVYALNDADGTVKWSHATGGIVRSSPAVGVDGTVYVGSQDNNLYAINPGSGSVKWTYAASDVIFSSPAIGEDGTIYVGSYDHNVYALNAADGTVKWSHATGSVIESSPAVGADGTIYVGSNNMSVYALNPLDGSVKWTYATGSAVYGSPAVGADGTVYVGNTGNNVYALNPADGTVKWTYATGSGVYSSPAIGADGTIYVGSNDKKVYALNPADGSVKWTYTAGDTVDSSPAIGADGTIYVGSTDMKVYALDPLDGSVKWAYATGSWVDCSPAIAADGTVYVGSYDHKVYAFGP